MVSDIRVDIKLPRHRKYKRLKRIIGVSPMEYLIVFWGNVAEQVPTGRLIDWSESDIEDAAGWDGEPGVLCSALGESGFLDTIENGFYPHDWEENQPWVFGAEERSESARNAANARWNKNGKLQTPQCGNDAERMRGAQTPQCGNDAERMRGAQTPQCGNDAPSPSPSPTPISKDDDAREKMSLSDFSRGYQATFGKMMPGGLNSSAQEICKTFPRSKIIEAFAITADNGGQTLKYLKEVLKGKPKPSASQRGQPKTFEQIQNESNLEALRKLGERINHAEPGDISSGDGKAAISVSLKSGRDKGSSLLAGIIPADRFSV